MDFQQPIMLLDESSLTALCEPEGCVHHLRYWWRELFARHRSYEFNTDCDMAMMTMISQRFLM